MYIDFRDATAISSATSLALFAERIGPAVFPRNRDGSRVSRCAESLGASLGAEELSRSTR